MSNLFDMGRARAKKRNKEKRPPIRSSHSSSRGTPPTPPFNAEQRVKELEKEVLRLVDVVMDLTHQVESQRGTLFRLLRALEKDRRTEKLT